MRITGDARVRYLLALAIVASVPPGTISGQEEPSAFPETRREAIRTYEETVAADKWADGPVEYLMLDYERDIWNSLDVDAEKQAFQAWFWDRRDPDPRDEDHEPRDEFYDRVARANQRFSGFPRGWRSDRGRVWVLLGAPTGGMRQTNLSNFGRCSARQGEWWTYYTQNMSFQASFGEFHVIFVETRVGQYEVCDPTMLGVGVFPADLRRAMEITAESMIYDTVTEFGAVRDSSRRAEGVLPVRDVEGEVEPLEVTLAEWGDIGVAGAVVIPVEIPLRDLLFEPVGETLRATLTVEAGLLAMGTETGRSGNQEWRIELDASTAADVGAASLRTALVLPAEPGGYAAQVRVTEPLSGSVRFWEDAVEVSAEGSAISPPLVGRSLIQLREMGEVAVLSARPSVLIAGEPFVAVSWVRGVTVDSGAVSLTLIGADGSETPVPADQIAWGNQAAAGPLIVQATLPEVEPGRYSLRIVAAAGLEPAESVVTVR